MTWTWIDDGFTDRREVMALSDKAFRLHVEALVFSNRAGRDGALDPADLVKLGRPDAVTVDEFVRAGLWEVTEAGWQVDWTDQETTARSRSAAPTGASATSAGGRTTRATTPCATPTVAGPSTADPSLTRESQRETTGDSRPPHSHSHSPSPKEGEEGEAPPADAGRPAEEEPPASPWVPVGDCPHAPGGRDTHIAFPDRIRCKDCAKAEKAKAHAEALAAARAELKQVATGDAS